jgi:hypothetical protein
MRVEMFREVPAALHVTVATFSRASESDSAVRQASYAGVCSAQSATTEQLGGRKPSCCKHFYRWVGRRKSGEPLFCGVWSEDGRMSVASKLDSRSARFLGIAPSRTRLL